MDVKAEAKYIRMSPRKVRLVTNLVKRLKVEKALSALRFVKKKAAQPVSKLIHSAVASAEHNYNLDKNSLFIKKIEVGEGPSLKRGKPVSKGRWHPILKRTSHIKVMLTDNPIDKRKVNFSSGEGKLKTKNKKLKTYKDRENCY